MLNIDQARRIAEVILSASQAKLSGPLVWVEPPLEFAGGWVFRYDSERFLETGDLGDAIGGNGPIAVFVSGDVEILSTVDSLAIQIRRLNSRVQS